MVRLYKHLDGIVGFTFSWHLNVDSLCRDGWSVWNHSELTLGVNVDIVTVHVHATLLVSVSLFHRDLLLLGSAKLRVTIAHFAHEGVTRAARTNNLGHVELLRILESAILEDVGKLFVADAAATRYLCLIQHLIVLSHDLIVEVFPDELSDASVHSFHGHGGLRGLFRIVDLNSLSLLWGVTNGAILAQVRLLEELRD